LRLTIFTSQWSVRFLDTVLLFTFSIDNHEIIALDREITHPLETSSVLSEWTAMTLTPPNK
jgi:hypothetical protein